MRTSAIPHVRTLCAVVARPRRAPSRRSHAWFEYGPPQSRMLALFGNPRPAARRSVSQQGSCMCAHPHLRMSALVSVFFGKGRLLPLRQSSYPHMRISALVHFDAVGSKAMNEGVCEGCPSVSAALSGPSMHQARRRCGPRFPDSACRSWNCRMFRSWGDRELAAP